MQIAVLGIDLGKNSCRVVGALSGCWVTANGQPFHAEPDQMAATTPATSRQVLKARLRAARYSVAERR